jgi:hypothetical protein
VTRFVMETDFVFEPVSALVIVLGGVLATLLAGLAFAWRPLRPGRRGCCGRGNRGAAARRMSIWGQKKPEGRALTVDGGAATYPLARGGVAQLVRAAES